ncbi:MAG: hypothetical protein J5626_01645, partial [Lachnospiraceae bacterium]|nr:hypothetical protein [Lachnospiraceae bacterium]
IRSAATKAYFNHCAFIGRQDTLYGDPGSTEAFYACDIYGGTDYIFGGMTAVFAKCNLIFNTSEDKNDVGYITAAQHKSAGSRGYLMYNCTVTSTVPGVNTASEFASKPGYLGRPWQANTSEVVFFDTVIEATCDNFKSASESLINPVGWLSTLSGTTLRNVEYGTFEVSGVNNASLRADWAPVSAEPKTSDGKDIAVATFLGDWDPFAENGNDMTIVFPDGTGEEEPIVVPTPEAPVTVKEYVLETAELASFAAGAKQDGDEEAAGTDNYFTIIYSVKSKVDSSNKSWEDGYASGQRINFGGAASTAKNAVKFTTSGSATVKVWWACGDAGREMTVLDSNGTAVVTSNNGLAKNAAGISAFELENAGTYYLGGSTGNNYIFKIEVTEGEASETPERAAWDKVSAPVVSSVSLSDANTVAVNVESVIGLNGGDKLTANMKDANGNVISSQSSSAEKDAFEFLFKPSASGTYFFDAVLSREDEETVKESALSDGFAFVLPLTRPSVKNVVNEGEGRVTINFYSVSEATSYVLTATDLSDEASLAKEDVYIPDTVVNNTKTEYGYTFEGLTIGHTYKIEVKAVRGNDKSQASGKEITVSLESRIAWAFSAFGSGVNSSEKNCGYSENADGTVTVWNTGNKGKIVPASTDGLAFYYATLPADKNFTLTATATIDSWTFTNGQEGFGLMACDRVGVNGDSTAFWNNSYMASGTKVEYYYDTIAGKVTDDSNAAKITMKNGLGAQEKTGVTLENLALLEAGDTATVNSDFRSKMYTLETSCGSKGAGTYNIWGKESSGSASTVENPQTTVTLRIQKNNTGYFVSVLDESGNVINTKKFYDTKALEKLDSEHVYVGFYASRTFTATFSNIELTLVAPEDDAPTEDKPVTYVTPNYSIVSAEHSNTAEYVLKYHGNADGTLNITDAQGKALIKNQAVKAGAVVSVKTKLSLGTNTFNVKFVPDSNFHPSGDKYQLLSSYDEANFKYTVTYKIINDAEEIFVSSTGSVNGDGSKENPVDIYTAVKFVKPGQTIRLAGGTYSLRETVTVERGIDGTADKPIRMIADPDDRAVFDFNKVCAGFVLAGNYWYISGIDCTHSGNSLKGIQLSGSHCTLKDIRTYENGNTGLQVSRYLGSDKFADWPGYDLILNCTSYSNADAGYEDADGFAAKLTAGNGIVFDGCISYNNADDGWDLFAKVETGSIGQVTIQNCVAFANGYGVDGKSEGNGNGFKMGGSSISGHHKLINSAAWGNKAKGIDSNSCPDVEVYHSTSFDNVGANVALYTNDTANTAFVVNGVMSYRTRHTDVSETLKLKGTQKQEAVYGTGNFYWNGGKSTNNNDLTVTDSWFVSLEAPYANVNDPYAVVAGLRGEDGRISLGNFLKLTDEGITALSAAGLEYKNVLAVLDGTYEALSDQNQIAVKEPASESGNTDKPSGNNSQGGTSQSGASQSGTSDSSSATNETAQDSASHSENAASHTETPGRGNTDTAATETVEETTEVTSQEQKTEETQTETVEEKETKEIEDTETAKSDTISESVDATAGIALANPEDAKKFPIVPVAVVTGIVAVLAAAIAVAAKKGLLAKILADLHIVK